MQTDNIIKKVEQFVKEEIKQADSAHDWWHIKRVCNNAKLIAKSEESDTLVVEIAALLHDVTDIKITGGTEEVQLHKLSSFLETLPLVAVQKENIVDSIAKQSFRKSLDGNQELSIEGKILQDADRLDAIGAIGIARVFAYGAAKGRELYNPQDKPQTRQSSDQYIKTGSTTAINHFYEKLLKLKDMMNTDTAKRIAKERHEFMQLYLNHFYKEWNGEQN